MADALVKWLPGKKGFYESHTMRKEDWQGLGFTGDDTEPVVFHRDKNFTVVADDLPFAQMDFFEDHPDYQVRKDTRKVEDGRYEGDQVETETGSDEA